MDIAVTVVRGAVESDDELKATFTEGTYVALRTCYVQGLNKSSMESWIASQAKQIAEIIAFQEGMEKEYTYIGGILTTTVKP